MVHGQKLLTLRWEDYYLSYLSYNLLLLYTVTMTL